RRRLSGAKDREGSRKLRQAQEHVSIFDNEHALDIQGQISKRRQRDRAVRDRPGTGRLQSAVEKPKTDLRRLCEEVKPIGERGRALLRAFAENDIKKLLQYCTVLVDKLGPNRQGNLPRKTVWLRMIIEVAADGQKA